MLPDDDPLARGRATVERGPDGLRIVVRARRQWFLIAFVSVWLVAWAFGWASVAGDLLRGDAGLFDAVWLVLWTLGGGVALTTVLWQLLGRERITAGPDALVVRQGVGPVGRTRRFRRERLERLRIHEVREPGVAGFFKRSFAAGSQLEQLGLTGGSLAVDYGARTHRFGLQLDEAEARLLLRELEAELGTGVREPLAA